MVKSINCRVFSHKFLNDLTFVSAALKFWLILRFKLLQAIRLRTQAKLDPVYEYCVKIRKKIDNTAFFLVKCPDVDAAMTVITTKSPPLY